MITVIIPVYNTVDYLSLCIESVINQSYKNFEILLIDDGSTDSSAKICRSYCQKDSRIVFLQKKNGGQATARNMGLDYAKGDFISFIDSDDEISEDVFENALKLFGNDNMIDVVQFPVFMNYGLQSQYLSRHQERKIFGIQNIFEEWIEKNSISWIVCDKIFKRELFDNLRFREGMVYEDNYMMAEVLSKIRGLFISDKGVYYYHSRFNSTTTSPHSMQKELDTQKVSLIILDKLNLYNSDKNLKLIILSRIFNVYQSLYYNYKFKGEMDENFIRELECISIVKIFKSSLTLTQKLKLCLTRTIGTKQYIKLHNL